MAIVHDVIINFRANVKGFLQGLGATQKEFKKTRGNAKKLQENYKQINTTAGRFALTMRRLTVGFRGFKAEFLSVMFFGMGLQRFFTGLLKPALQVTGVFELWASVLQVLFLPIALAILDFLLPWFEVLLNLSDATKLFIGKIVLLGAALGIFLFLLGTIALGIAGVILVFSGLFNIIDKLIPDIKVMGINFSSFIEAGLAIGLVSKAVEFLKNTFGGLLDRLLEIPIVQEFIDNFKDGIDDIKEKIKKFTGDDEDGSLGIIEQTIQDAKEAWTEFSEGMKSKIKELDIPSFVESFKNLAITLEELIPSFRTIAGFITTIAKGINIFRLATGIGFDPSAIAASQNISPNLANAPLSTRIYNSVNTINVQTTGSPLTQADVDRIIEASGNRESVNLGSISRR